MNSQLAFTVGPCCVKCKTPAGNCATKFSCKHHLTNLSTAVERQYQADTEKDGQLEARQKFAEGRGYDHIHTGMKDAGVDPDDATDWIKSQMEDLQASKPELFEVDLSEEGRAKAWFERWIDGDTRR
ncbi:hypothetical protein ABDK96_02010 [Citricoccus nitrophenolicus]|uniref:Uncharacterized protein n=1 Tax=Citricoccus nitrophenolicus TaxID=863575 RepID=A0ABV0IE68_9MICC